MTNFTQKACGRQYAVGVCDRCQRTIKLRARGMCVGCLNAERRQSMIGDCISCMRKGVPIRARGQCSTCSTLSSGGGEDRRNRRCYTSEEIAAAVARQADYEEQVLPVVRRLAWKMFRGWPYHAREEIVAEVCGLSWLHFIHLLSIGKEPCGMALRVAFTCIDRAKAWMRVSGYVSKVDALSRRVKYEHGIEAFGIEDTLRKRGFITSAREEREINEWLESLPRRLREIVEFLTFGGSWKEACSKFCLTLKEKQDVLQQLHEAWQARSDS